MAELSDKEAVKLRRQLAELEVDRHSVRDVAREYLLLDSDDSLSRLLMEEFLFIRPLKQDDEWLKAHWAPVCLKAILDVWHEKIPAHTVAGVLKRTAPGDFIRLARTGGTPWMDAVENDPSLWESLLEKFAFASFSEIHSLLKCIRNDEKLENCMERFKENDKSGTLLAILVTEYWSRISPEGRRSFLDFIADWNTRAEAHSLFLQSAQSKSFGGAVEAEIVSEMTDRFLDRPNVPLKGVMDIFLTRKDLTDSQREKCAAAVIRRDTDGDTLHSLLLFSFRLLPPDIKVFSNPQSDPGYAGAAKITADLARAYFALPVLKAEKVFNIIEKYFEHFHCLVDPLISRLTAEAAPRVTGDQESFGRVFRGIASDEDRAEWISNIPEAAFGIKFLQTIDEDDVIKYWDPIFERIRGMYPKIGDDVDGLNNLIKSPKLDKFMARLMFSPEGATVMEHFGGGNQESMSILFNCALGYDISPEHLECFMSNTVSSIPENFPLPVLPNKYAAKNLFLLLQDYLKTDPSPEKIRLTEDFLKKAGGGMIPFPGDDKKSAEVRNAEEKVLELLSTLSLELNDAEAARGGDGDEDGDEDDDVTEFFPGDMVL